MIVALWPVHEVEPLLIAEVGRALTVTGVAGPSASAHPGPDAV